MPVLAVSCWEVSAVRSMKPKPSAAAVFPALQRAAAAQHVHAAAAVEAGVLVHNALFKGHGQGDYLEGRSGLVGVRDGLVAPLLLLGKGVELVILLLALCGGAYLGLGLGADGLVIVQVEIAKGHHRQYSTRVNLHTDSRRAVLDVVVLHGLGEVLFDVALDDSVYRQGQAVAVVGVHVVLVALVEHIRPRRGGGAHDVAVFAREQAVIA